VGQPSYLLDGLLSGPFSRHTQGFFFLTHPRLSALSLSLPFTQSNVPHEQGAVVAVRVALALGDKPLGGVIAVSSALLEEEVLTCPAIKDSLRQTPMLVTHGQQDQMVDIASARRHVEHLRQYYSNQELVQWKEYNKGHDMVKSKEEMGDVMAFFSRHLVLRSIALEQRDDLIQVVSG